MEVRDLRIIEIPPRLASRLNAEWHSILPRIHPSNIVRNRHYACFAAYYGDAFNILAVAIWTSPIARNLDQERILELRRLAISPGAPKNTATWFLSRMIKLIKRKFPGIEKLISYQDISQKGTIYKAANWKMSGRVKFRSWARSRKRNPDQSTNDKVRWVYELK